MLSSSFLQWQVLGQFMDLMEAKELIPALLSEDDAIDAFEAVVDPASYLQLSRRVVCEPLNRC